MSAFQDHAVTQAAAISDSDKFRVLWRVRNLEVMFGEGAEGDWFDDDDHILSALMLEELVVCREVDEAAVYETTAKGRAML